MCACLIISTDVRVIPSRINSTKVGSLCREDMVGSFLKVFCFGFMDGARFKTQNAVHFMRLLLHEYMWYILSSLAALNTKTSFLAYS